MAAGGSVCRRDELVRLSAANNLVTQMRGRAAAIRRSVNRRHNLAITGSRADSSEASSTGASAQHNQTQHNQINRLGHWQCLQPPPCAESPQLYRASDHRINGPAKPVGRRQIPHFANPYLLQLLGFEEMILLRTGGLAASPPVRYTLETAEQCHGEARGPRGPALACGPSSRHRRFRRLLGLAARHRASGRLDVAPSIF